MRLKVWLIGLACLVLAACQGEFLNSPYHEQSDVKTLYTSFSLRPKHLDPARSYSSNEAAITGQIYEPPYQYHFLKRPYTLEPLSAAGMPELTYLNELGQVVDADTDSVAYTLYTIPIQSNILYQPHPAFAQADTGEFLYHALTHEQLNEIEALGDFDETGTRALKAEDFVYQIKRLAHPELHSPILGLMAEYIVGLGDYATLLRQQRQSGQPVDLRRTEIEGVKALDETHYQIKVYGKYPQLKYWLAMPFFAPIPWEADVFYQQQGLIERNITIDWYPVGTGPFYMTENNPNRRMVLTKNPNFHGETYPAEGEPKDAENGLLTDAGKALPLIDEIIFSLEKENTSYWGKFMQGYYDVSGISSDSFDQAVQVSSTGEFGLSDEMKAKGIDLVTAVGTSSFYMGFNMLDPVVGGDSEAAKKLRHAISIAIDYEEYISIFANGRGIPAQGPVPPGIFGYKEGEGGTNPYVYKWSQREATRRDIQDAKQLLAEAGYPNGRDEQTGEPLVLNLDVPASGPDSKAQLDWLRKQFSKINVQLRIRSTDYNRFQDKMRQGQAQIFQWGWNADYPDPENFLFLLYGPNGKVETGGENAANYRNAAFDELFEQMRVMPDTPERFEVIQKMVDIVREDAPWVWGYHPKMFTLYHQWNQNVKPNLMANNTLKYRALDTATREKMREKWNKPLIWPLFALSGLIILMLLPAAWVYRRKKYKKMSVSLR
jgi:ABC-type transport system substrate-binding protein